MCVCSKGAESFSAFRHLISLSSSQRQAGQKLEGALRVACLCCLWRACEVAGMQPLAVHC